MSDFTPNLFKQIFDQLGRQEFPQNALYVVATPIGNLADITFRAYYTLNLVDGIACEDTRHSQILLNQLGINKPLLAIHQHNEREGGQKLVNHLLAGQRWAYISDAGTPGISDPGAKLVESCLENNIRVIPIPGPSAIVSLASVAGESLDTSEGRFQFLGFAPTKGAEQTSFFKILNASHVGTFFYESPQRIEKSLKLLHAALTDTNRSIVIGRELTKKFDTIDYLKASDIPNWLGENSQLRGEFIVFVSGKSGGSEEVDPQGVEMETLARDLSTMLKSKQLAEILSKHFEISKKDAYDLALSFKDKS